MCSVNQQNPNKYLTADIDKLIAALDSLVDGDLAVSMLVASGPRAIEPLSVFLLDGKAKSIADSRRRTVRALAELGATDVLCRYIERPRELEDATVRFSEETVESLAAELLSQWHSDTVFDALLQLSKTRMLLGLCTAFGNLGRAESIPFLIEALGDDVCSVSAGDALCKFGDNALPALKAATKALESSRDDEPPSSVKRRLAALRILSRIANTDQILDCVRPCMHDANHSIAVNACMVGLDTSSGAEKTLLASRLLSMSSNVDWLTQSEISDALIKHAEELSWVLNLYASAPGQSLVSQRIARSVLRNVPACKRLKVQDSNIPTVLSASRRTLEYLKTRFFRKKARPQG